MKFTILECLILYIMACGIYSRVSRLNSKAKLKLRISKAAMKTFRVGKFENSYLVSRAFYKKFFKQDCTIDPKELPNSNWLSVSYDMQKANPIIAPQHGALIDPGYRSDIFKLEFSKELTADALYYKPKGYLVERIYNSCTTKSNTSPRISSKSELESQTAGISGGIEVGKELPEDQKLGFGLNFEYKSVEKKIQSEDKSFYITEISCPSYKATLNIDDPPTLKDEFITELTKLNGKIYNDSTMDLFYAFLDTYGTHVLKEVTMGSKVVMVSEFENSKLNEMKKSETNVEANVSLFIVEVSVETKSTSDSKKEMESSMTNYYLKSVGAPLPDFKSQDTDLWMKSTVTTPMPIYQKILKIENLLNNANIISQLKAKNINTDILLSEITAAENDYCNILVKKGMIETCKAAIPTKLRQHYTNWEEIKSIKWTEKSSSASKKGIAITDLTNHPVDCGVGNGIKSFYFQFTDSNWRIIYECIQTESVTETCEETSNEISLGKYYADKWSKDDYSNYKLINMDTNDTQATCPSGSVLSKWKVHSEVRELSATDKTKYHYLQFQRRCCKANLQSCTTQTKPQMDLSYYDFYNFKNDLLSIDGNSESSVIQGWKLSGNRDTQKASLTYATCQLTT